MEAKAREMKSEITKLRERIVWLESEEKGVRNGIAAREKEMELAEKAMRELFADIGTEITGIKKKVEEIAAESASAQPIPQGDSIMTDILGGKKGSNEQKIEVIEPSAPQDTKPHKKCPMCGGQMNDYGDKWQCYACAHEELKKDEVQVKSESNESFAPQDAESRKKCPMCGGQMSDYGDKWQCYSCAHEESKEGEVKGKSELTNAPKPASAPAPISDLFPAVVPSASLFPDEKQEQKKGSVQSQHQSLPKTKNCPVCQKKMIWYDLEKLWRCSNCDYQRSI
jgi:ribosomal protein S27AE